VREEDLRLPDGLAYKNIEAEQCCLGAAMQDQKSVNRLKEMTLDDFTEPEHRVLYSAILEMANKGLDVDLVTIHTALSEQNKLELIGGDMYLLHLLNNVVTTANMGSYVNIVRECTARRKLKTIGEELVRKSGYLDEEVDAIREGAALAVRDVKSSAGVKIISQQEAVMSTYELLEEAQKREGKENNRIMTGIKPLDRMTGGLSGSKLMIIGARPSVGKSIFAMTICMNAAKQGKKVLYVSCEMEVEELMEREFAGISMVPLTEITSDEISDDGWIKMAEALPEVASRQLFYCTEIHLVEDVRKAAFQLYENGGLDLVCVDYIQLLKTAQKRNSRQEEVADISRSLKWLAQELKIPVIALSQLNRASTREKRPPTMAEARESGAIEQDANIFLLLHDPDTDELKSDDLRRLSKTLGDRGMKLIYVNVDKNRQGKKGVFYIAFDGDHMRFMQISKEDPPA
jgi:replicative DNA helicase